MQQLTLQRKVQVRLNKWINLAIFLVEFVLLNLFEVVVILEEKMHVKQLENFIEIHVE